MNEKRFMINVDFETKNKAGGQTDCKSELHQNLGPHYDLTVHKLGAPCRRKNAPHRPPTRYWDDNDGNGYNLTGVVHQIRSIIAQRGGHARRCRRCKKVPDHLPDWD